MNKENIQKLKRSYLKYRTAKKKINVLGFFRALMPEIIFRTTALEGEPVTRRMVSSVLK